MTKPKTLGMYKQKPAAWIRCLDCDDYVCTIHEEHAADCSCPAIEAWAEAGHCPYDDPVTKEIADFVAENPIDMDE